MRVVAAIYSDDLKAICPQKNKPRVEHPKTGASGHVFVAIHFPDGWRLINTIDGTNYEWAPWFEPQDVSGKMASKPLFVPFATYRNFPPHLRSKSMVVFQSWKVEDVPIHTFDQRLDLIASGEIMKPKAKMCRYGKAEVRYERHEFF